VLASCAVGAYPISDAYDSADGYVYVASIIGSVSIVKPPCTLVSTMSTGGSSEPYGTAYDPLTKEIVVTDDASSLAYVLRGTHLAETVGLGVGHTPLLEAWDPAVGAMLIADGGGARGGVDILYLTYVNGITRSAVILDPFDQGNHPAAVLVADGYIFSAGNAVDVFNDRTFAFVGSFAVESGSLDVLAWDPLNDTVVLGGEYTPPRHSVVFLDGDSIRSGLFAFGTLPIYFVWGLDGVAYSPATHDVFLSGFGAHSEVEVSSSGEVTRVALPGLAGPAGLAYDPVNHYMYLCAYASATIDVLR
jgi:DNA-binding beta-propeller fold protein YncE